MNHQTIPLRKELDQLKLLELDAKASASHNHAMLDLRAYWEAKAARAPLPCFRALNGKGIPTARVRLLSVEDQEAIRTSSEPVEVLARRYSVDQLIVQDIKSLPV